MYTMNQTCQAVGMTYETLKYYCNEGLIPNVKRDKNNYRVFDENDIEWIRNLTCLKKCGMSIQDMKIYIKLCLEGESSIPERKIILDKQKDELLDRINELQECVEYINWKQQFYDDVISGKTKYYSNLIEVED
ncbi:MAG: MerR family transcriptional regulator [uncultured Clostridium sp.]